MQRMKVAVDGVDEPLSFLCDNRPGLAVPFAWCAAGALHAAPAGSHGHRLAEAAVSWLAWYLSAATDTDETHNPTSSPDNMEQKAQIDSPVCTAELVRRAVSGPAGNDDKEQRVPVDNAASPVSLPFALQAYGWLARSRYVSDSKSPRQPVKESFAEVVECLLQHSPSEDQDTGDAATATATAAPVSDTLSLPPVVARAVLDLVHEWLNDAQASAAAYPSSASCSPFPDGFWVAVVQHLKKFWVAGAQPAAGSQAQTSTDQLRRNSALATLRRIAAGCTEAVIGKDSVDAAKALLAAAST